MTFEKKIGIFLKKFLDCIFCFKVRDSDTYREEFDCIIGLSFGGQENGSSPVNISIWNAATNFYKSMILQWEIDDAGMLLRSDRKVAKRISAHRLEGEYLDTEEVLSQAQVFCIKHELKKPLIIAFHSHLPRVKWQAEKIFGTGNFSVLGVNVPYDQNSFQWWTRGPLRWWIREIPGRIFLLLKGEI